MQFGIDVSQQRIEWDELVARVQFGEACGFTGAWGFDHFQPMYGEGPGDCFDGMTTLAALAPATTRIRLGLLVTGVTYRHPSVFAAQAITIDHASHGRLELSFGAAWFEPEHHALGIPFPPAGARFDLLEDALEIVTRLMTGERVLVSRARRCRSTARRCGPSPSSIRTRRSGSAPTARSAALPIAARSAPTCGTPSARPSTTRSCRSGSTSSPRRRAATRRRSAGPGRSPSRSRGTRCGATPTRCAPSASATSCAAGPATAKRAVGEFAERVMSEFTE